MAPLLCECGHLGTVVEVGCGVGAPATHLAGTYDRYVGIDQSEELVEAARHLNRDNPAAEFFRADVKDVDWLDQQADLVLAIGALHHMSNLPQVLASLSRLAKPAARLVLVEPLRSNPIVAILRSVRLVIDPGYSRDQVFFGPEELTSLVKDAGLREVEVVFQGHLSTPFAQVVLPLGLVARLGSRAAVTIDTFIDRHLEGLFARLAWNQIVRARF